jgi:hypothetical protein
LVNKSLGDPEPQVRDVAAALLNLAPPARRTAIGPLIAMIERVVANQDRDRAGEDRLPDRSPSIAGKDPLN